ncbi:lipopolysaccharide biosynthesis protein [Qipengyuania sp. CAU 1752]
MTLARAGRAGLWGGVELLAKQGTNFIAVIFLARLLTPAEFGIFAMVVLVVALAGVLTAGGFGTLIIQRDLTDDELARIFTFVACLSILAGALVWLSGQFIVRFYDFPALAEILPVVACQPLLASVATVPSALLTKQLRFRPLAVVGVIASATAGLAAVIVALGGGRLWALVVQMMLSALVTSIGLWIIAGWRPRLRFDWSAILPALRFVGPISLTQALQIFYMQGAALIVAKRYSAADLGLFNRGLGVTQLFNQLFSGITARVALPLLSESRDDNGAMIHRMRRGTTGMMFLAVPAFIGLSFLARDLLLILYGPQWVDAAPVLTILALAGITMPMQAANANLLIAKGMSRTYFNLELVKRSLGIGLIVAGSFFGIVGVAWAYFAASITGLLLHTRQTRLSFEHGLVAQLRDILGILFASALMALTLWGVDQSTAMESWVRIVALGAIGATSYLATGWLSDIGSFRRITNDVVQVIMRLKRAS